MTMRRRTAAIGALALTAGLAGCIAGPAFADGPSTKQIYTDTWVIPATGLFPQHLLTRVDSHGRTIESLSPEMGPHSRCQVDRYLRRTSEDIPGTVLSGPWYSPRGILLTASVIPCPGRPTEEAPSPSPTETTTPSPSPSTETSSSPSATPSPSETTPAPSVSAGPTESPSPTQTVSNEPTTPTPSSTMSSEPTSTPPVSTSPNASPPSSVPPSVETGGSPSLPPPSTETSSPPASVPVTSASSETSGSSRRSQGGLPTQQARPGVARTHSVRSVRHVTGSQPSSSPQPAGFAGDRLAHTGAGSTRELGGVGLLLVLGGILLHLSSRRLRKG